MPTTKQKKAIKIAAENGGNISKAMREAGYSPVTAATPSKLTNSKAYEELIEELGLTDELLLGSLIEDIQKNPGKRTRELELGFKLKGRLKEAPQGGQTNIITLILKKWGLDDVGQDPSDESGLSQN